MYREHFGLTTSPFGISPRLDFLYRSSAFEESMAHLVYGLESSEAIVMITGAIGTGKTMAIQSFLTHLGDRYLTALVTNTSVDAKGLLKLVLDDLNCPVPPGADKSDLLIAFKQLIIDAGRDGKRVIVVIDEAQNLSREVLEEIRLLTNLGQGEQQPVQIVLVGQPELDAMVARADLVQLRQRIRVHYKLVTLTRPELGEYVDHRMVVAGAKPGVFSSGALDRIFAFSGGVPRVVNTLCAEALLAAYVAGHDRVEARDVESPGDDTTEPAAPGIAVPSSEATSRPDMAVRRPPAGSISASAFTPGVGVAKPEPAAPAARAGDARGRRERQKGSARRASLVAALVVVLARAAYVVWTRSWERFLPVRQAARQVPSVVAAVPRVGGGTGLDQTDSTAGTLPSAADTLASTPAAHMVPTVPMKTDIPASNDTIEEQHASLAAARTPSAGAGSALAAGEVLAEVATTGRGGGAPVQTVDSESWYIHVSSFRTPEQAASAAAWFRDRGDPATVREQMIASAAWYRVYLGPFSDRVTAVNRADQLRSQGDITYYKLQRLVVSAP